MPRKGPFWTHAEALEAAGKAGTVERDRLWWVVTPGKKDAKEGKPDGDQR